MISDRSPVLSDKEFHRGFLLMAFIFAAAFCMGMFTHHIVDWPITPGHTAPQVINPTTARDYGNIERACTRYMARMSSNEVAQKMAEDTKQELIKLGVIK